MNNPTLIDTDRLVAQQLDYTVQSFPKEAMTAGVFLTGEFQRGPILPPYGTKERDRILRIFDRYEYNGIWQGAIAGLIKKIASSPFSITGTSDYTNFYQVVLQKAHYGQGWDVFIKKVLRDYLTQDYGAFIEKIGPGPSDGPLLGPVIGLAHKDSSRCYLTGNPTWPVVYYSLWDGRLHKMHHTRVIRFVDMPDTDERFFGIGLCALSRCIGAANREIRMGRYVDSYLDDKPKPGITSISGLTKQQFEKVSMDYAARQKTDNGDVFGQTLMLFSLDADKEILVKEMPFAQTPEKFDLIKYVDLDVNSIALGLGVDRQELWELGGKMLGSASQSNVLAQKAESKAFGDITQNFTRIMNIDILPTEMNFGFRTKNTIVDAAQSEIDQRLTASVQVVASIPNAITPNEVRKFLTNQSVAFNKAFEKDDGSIELGDGDVETRNQEIALADDAPADKTGNKLADKVGDTPINSDVGAQPLNEKEQKTKIHSGGQVPIRKEIDSTQSDFADALVSLIKSKTNLDRRSFGITFRSTLKKSGMQSFKDGLEKGGVLDQLDESDKAQVMDWFVRQSSYIRDFANTVYAKDLDDSEIERHAAMWAKNSLSEIYFEGLMSADRNGTYMWKLGNTEKHCKDCERLDGQVHRFSEWYSRKWLPQSVKLNCTGRECDCRLVKVKALSRGRF